eukprot:5647934-Prymnesium_polylepis.2
MPCLPRAPRPNLPPVGGQRRVHGQVHVPRVAAPRQGALRRLHRGQEQLCARAAREEAARGADGADQGDVPRLRRDRHLRPREAGQDRLPQPARAARAGKQMPPP